VSECDDKAWILRRAWYKRAVEPKKNISLRNAFNDTELGIQSLEISKLHSVTQRFVFFI
jgi:hypothetical protein